MTKEILFSVQKKDFKIQTFKSGGKGGQHQNKTDSGVRIIHPASGAVGEARSTKSQHRNKRLALVRLTRTAEFRLWVNQLAYEISRKKSVEESVNEQMRDAFLKIEVKDHDGRWVEEQIS